MKVKIKNMITEQANSFRYVKELARNTMLHLNGEKKDKKSANVCLERLYQFAEMCEKFHNSNEY